MTTLVSITIERSVKTPKLGLSSKWRIFFPLSNDYILGDSGDFFYPMAQIFMYTIQTSSFVDMLTCSDEVHPSTVLFFIIKLPYNARSDWLKQRALSEIRERVDGIKLAQIVN